MDDDDYGVGVIRDPAPPDEMDAREWSRVTSAVGVLVDETHRVPTFTQVAERSGIAETTLRRRWATSSMLLIDALDEDAERGDYEVTITGDLRADLTETGRQLTRYLSTPRGLCFLRTVIVSVANPLEPMTPGHPVIMRRLDGIQALLDAASETHLTVRDLVDGLIAPLFLRMSIARPAHRRDVEATPYVEKLLRLSGSRTLDGVGGPR